MAVNDLELTTRVKAAQLYFALKEQECEGKRSVKVDNGDMIEAAAYAAGYFKTFHFSPEIVNGWIKKGVYAPAPVMVGESSDSVLTMSAQYAHGTRDFGSDALEQAKRVCHSLVDITKHLQETGSLC